MIKIGNKEYKIRKEINMDELPTLQKNIKSMIIVEGKKGGVYTFVIRQNGSWYLETAKQKTILQG